MLWRYTTDTTLKERSGDFIEPVYYMNSRIRKMYRVMYLKESFGQP